MQNHIQSLNNVKNDLPLICNVANIKRLSTLFLEYKFIVSKLPEKYAAIKSRSENNFLSIKSKIDDISDTRYSPERTKNFFKEACVNLGAEIDNILSKIE